MKPTTTLADELSQFHRIPSRRTTRWKRTLLLVPVLVSLFFVAGVEDGHPALSRVTQARIIAALKDPLSLFAERSPGGRGSGALLSTKPNKKTALAGTVPEERVLSNVRERVPPLGSPIAAEDPVFADAPGVLGKSGALPGDDTLPEDQVGGSPFSAPFLPFSAFGGPGFIPGPGGGPELIPNPSGLLPTASAVPEDQVGGSPSSPPGGPGFIPGPGGGPELNPDPPLLLPTASAVPEPATWAMLILGFFAVGVAVRRRARKQPDELPHVQ